jgi:cellulose synthase/poly-beta-1,6-N-acetylglucosamine synthase-like glycosyltransferase
MSRRRYLLAPVVLGVVAALALVALLAELVPVGPPLSFVLLAFDTRVLLGLAVTIFAASFLLYLYRLRGENPSALVADGRPVEALVPVYRDSAVMDRSVEGLVASTYGNLTVTIICEPDDEPALQRAARLADRHEAVRRLVNEARQGSKAGALNAAIERSDADVVAMFDADQEPHPELLAHGMAALETHDAARVRSLPRPGGLVESEAYYEYLLLFFLPQKLARFLFGFGVVGTRSVLLERSVFETVGLLDEETLTEDMDFTHACHQAGVSVRELLYYPCFEQPAHTLGDWWGQRVRWMTGHVEVGHSQLRRWRDLPDLDVAGSLVTLLGTFVAGVLLALTVPKVLVAATAHPVAVGAGLAGIYGISLATRLVDNRAAGLEGVGMAWLLLPVFLSLYGLVIVRVLVGYTLGVEREWYRADKRTEP